MFAILRRQTREGESMMDMTDLEEPSGQEVHESMEILRHNWRKDAKALFNCLS